MAIDARYDRQLVLDGIGEAGQSKLCSAHVLVVGVGGVGSAVAMALAAAGIEALTLWDDDRVELSNLHRQTLFAETDIGARKADCAARRIRQVNSKCAVTVVPQAATSARLTNWLHEDRRTVAAIVDATDNPTSRQALGDFAVQRRLPLVTAAAIGWHGQVGLYRLDLGAACVRCLVATAPHAADHCEGSGVAGPVPAVVGGMAAISIMRLLMGDAQEQSTMQTWDAIRQRTLMLDVRQEVGCQCVRLAVG